MFLLGRSAVEDFFEIWVLGGNGYGFGAMKILRTLFEKVATAGYLCNHPNEIQAFHDYGIVQYFKIIQRLKRTAEFASLIPADSFSYLEPIHEKVKASFQEKKCSECGRGNSPSWTKLDMYSLSQKAGYQLDEHAALVYAMSNLVIHATSVDMAERKIPNGDGTFRFNNNEQEAFVDRALSAGVVLFITNMLIQDKYFGLQMEQPIALLFKSVAESFEIAPTNP